MNPDIEDILYDPEDPPEETVYVEIPDLLHLWDDPLDFEEQEDED